jgi:threonine dehydrogenase-like Zn-dependent dehydrogenase
MSIGADPGRHSPVIWRSKLIGTPIDIDRLRVVGIDQGATDAIVRITTSTICGTGLHILKGNLPAVTPGRILGHEGIGVVMRNVRLLQERHVLALPRRRLDPG